LFRRRLAGRADQTIAGQRLFGSLGTRRRASLLRHTGNTIAREAVGSIGDLIQFADGTIINLVGVSHTVFT
jgi:hypothetical protein